MKIEKAYSTDVSEVIDVETAYDLYWGGKIDDKRNFECIFSDCDGPITAANLDRLRHDMFVDPYYRKSSIHSKACSTDTESKHAQSSTDDDAHGRPRVHKSNALADIFGLNRPLSHTILVSTTSSTDVNTNPLVVKKRKKQDASTGEPRASTHYSLLAFVSKYHRYRSQEIDDTKFINIKGHNIAYADMFVPVDAQPIEELSEFPRVYFGRAYVDEKPNGYRIGFLASLTLNSVTLRPSLYIPDDLIQNAFSRNIVGAD
ncbi:MAG: hypothetical protein HHJ12_16465 [Glaciimonas sp.]|nr:hypothetical protein [Glaciimonas sp.]